MRAVQTMVVPVWAGSQLDLAKGGGHRGKRLAWRWTGDISPVRETREAHGLRGQARLESGWRSMGAGRHC